ncbi:MAG: class I SAM-dependent methyltransferase [Proteobacteria bacterium]|nr:class I SAM-dependent methyltransferase [Pseudomonadota bacterium]
MQSSGYIQRLKQEKREKSKSMPLSALERSIRLKEPEDFPCEAFINKIGCRDLDHFIDSMFNQVAELKKRFDPKPDWAILDLGSGVGRVAFPFVEYLSEKGRYYGVDVWPEGVAWCQKHFSSNFSFTCLESPNNYYFSEGPTQEENHYKIPFVESNSIDLVFAVSLFSHLVKNDVRAYMNEIGRVLKSGRCCYLTGFLMDKYFFEYRERTQNFKRVEEKEKDCYYGYTGQDFFAGFPPAFWQERAEEAGLEFIGWELGKWAEKPGAASFQDILLFRKP